jgi:hypothetical protein
LTRWPALPGLQPIKKIFLKKLRLSIIFIFIIIFLLFFILHHLNKVASSLCLPYGCNNKAKKKRAAYHSRMSCYAFLPKRAANFLSITKILSTQTQQKIGQPKG